ncbi:MAG: WD40/YVTN/BNR-like repeat-containing protein, partial [Candidatus Angelobacter sp.]
MAQQWRAVGPDGGSVRSLALDPANPERVFLGTSAGRLYFSNDGGRTWSRFAHLGTASEMVLDHVVLDPANPQIMYVAGWNAQSPGSDGEMFRSKDGGKTWDLLPGLHGKSIRALAVAPSDHRILIVGALDGIFRSRDGGDN